MKTVKDTTVLLRMTEYEAEQANFFAKKIGISRAELFRRSLRIIALDEKPSESGLFRGLHEKR